MALITVPYSEVSLFVREEMKKNKDLAKVIRHLRADTRQISRIKARDPNNQAIGLLQSAVDNYKTGLDMFLKEVIRQFIPVLAKANVLIEKSSRLSGFGDEASEFYESFKTPPTVKQSGVLRKYLKIPVVSKLLYAIGLTALGLLVYNYFGKGNEYQDQAVKMLNQDLENAVSRQDYTKANELRAELKVYLLEKGGGGWSWKEYLALGVVGYFVLFYLPGIVRDWSGAAGAAKALRSDDDKPIGRGARTQLPPGYGFPVMYPQQVPAQRQPRGGNHGGPAAPQASTKKKPKTGPRPASTRTKA